MKTIKKISVAPLPKNEGTIIDSFDTTDDKTKNAPSINAVEKKISTLESEITALESKVYIKDDYAVLTGSLTVSANITNNATLNYPTGFNKDNCVPISFGKKRSDSNLGYCFDSDVPTDTTSIFQTNGINGHFLRFNDSNISVYIKNTSSSDLTYNFKIVLMKLN